MGLTCSLDTCIWRHLLYLFIIQYMYYINNVAGRPPDDLKEFSEYSEENMEGGPIASASVELQVFETIGLDTEYLKKHRSRKRQYIDNVSHLDFRRSVPVSTCTREYRQYPGHTMCKNDNPNLIKSGLRRGAAQFILKEHNRYRGSVLPPATDLPKLKWNDKLAEVAQKWANQCIMGHDKVRVVPGLGKSVGQNVAGGYQGWRGALKAWYGEIELYRYGEDPKIYLGPDGGVKIGHFTQMMTNTTVMVGCGYAVCSNTKYTRYFVCDYLTGQSRFDYPYTVGARCSKCPDTCQKGICDCGGKFCHNGGTLDLNTCQCSCQSPYVGEICSDLSCPPKDRYHCTSQWDRSMCDQFLNVPFTCPYMCGLCVEKDKNRYYRVDRGHGIAVNGKVFYKSNFGCEFYGKRPSNATCSKYGDKGKDIKHACAAYGGKFDCEDCERFYNIPSEYCPVMCGLCDPPCSAKICQNGGTLDTASCTCRCKQLYSGKTCEKLSCPKEDRWDCPQMPQSYCEEYRNIPYDCPYKCGTCKY